MKHTVLPALSLVTLLLAGCSTPTQVEKGPIHARTFSFVITPPRPAQFADKREAVHTLIHEAITKTLATKGLSRVAADGDVTVAYLVIVGNSVSTTYINDYFGYSEDMPGLMNKAQEAYTGGKNPNYFEAGTLVIDLVDRAGKLVWRSYATRPLLGDVAMEVRAEHIQGAVDEALANLRVAQ
jgi:hypothetical protein